MSVTNQTTLRFENNHEIDPCSSIEQAYHVYSKPWNSTLAETRPKWWDQLRYPKRLCSSGLQYAKPWNSTLAGPPLRFGLYQVFSKCAELWSSALSGVLFLLQWYSGNVEPISRLCWAFLHICCALHIDSTLLLTYQRF